MLELTSPQSIKPPRFPRVGPFLNKFVHWGLRLARKHRYDDFRLERIDGTPLLILPSVFNPKLLLTGEFFASLLDSSVVAPHASVLDMGTGSGVCAIFAARQAARVTAVDINAAAVRCARSNALLNQLDHKIDVRHGDLFDPVAGEQFDLVLFNPPFLTGIPRNDRDRAWRSNDVAERFAAGLRQHLKSTGYALILLSTYGEPEAFLSKLRAHGFEVTVHAQQQLVAETIAVFRLEPSQRQEFS